MSMDSDISPVGWYIGTYQLRCVELADQRREHPKRRYLVWENTALVKARNLAQAYRKLVKVGKAHTRPYKGGPDAIDVQWVFEGVVELLPIYEAIEDGAELMWAERTRSLATIRRQAKSAAELASTPVASRPTRSPAKRLPS